MNTLHIVIAAILCLGPLIAIHEFGHFWVARRLGVKVLVYSIGFGPALLKWHGRDGVLYQIAAVPLGGYVKMADEREGEVAPQDLPFAFNRQSPWKRMAIVAAGPLINLLLAVLLFWLLFLPASQQLNTRLGVVLPDTPAAEAGLQVGDKVLSVDGRQTATWEDINYALVERMGESGTIAVTVEQAGQPKTLQLPINQFLKSSGDNPFERLGFLPYQPFIEPVLGQLVEKEAGIMQGLKQGDRILKIDQTAITQWSDVTRIIRQSPAKPLLFTVSRNGQAVQLNIVPKVKKDALGVAQGFLGVGPVVKSYKTPTEYIQTIQYSPLTALSMAFDKTWQLSVVTVKSIGKLVTGAISLNNLSGPITIAKVAGQTAEMGLPFFIGFMAVMSVSLGVLNLLPIPVLDGGHLVYYFVEALQGKPISEKIQQIGFRVGIVLLGTMMVLALFNDFTRLG